MTHSFLAHPLVGVDSISIILALRHFSVISYQPNEGVCFDINMYSHVPSGAGGELYTIAI